MALPPVKHAALVRVGSTRVWDALVRPEQLAAWFGCQAEVEPRVGGRLDLRWEHWGPDDYTGDSRGTIEELEPRRRLAFRWTSHPSHPETRVQIDLEPRGPITVVRLEETGFVDAAHALVANAAGWGEAITLLKFWLEHGVRY